MQFALFASLEQMRESIPGSPMKNAPPWMSTRSGSFLVEAFGDDRVEEGKWKHVG